ncbi:MAG: 2'-5' RNA ligase family protein [Nanoarchaeota archaeon]|nr:2'-5' RNA ligase family protein [Nanoarchaeota archaeon]MBU1028398.1 2'-5' RNA ligase family protein [Nanoarchaeota archaeon]
MRYYIGHLVDDKIKKHYGKILSELSSRFKLENLVKKDRRPHITLKAPFEREDIADVENFLDNFCKDLCSSTFKIKGYGNFGKEDIFLEVVPSDILKITFGRFLKEIKNLPGMHLGEYDSISKKLHVTLLKPDEMNSKFKEIWSYLDNKEFSTYSKFDNITIFKKQNKKTLIHNIYPLVL